MDIQIEQVGLEADDETTEEVETEEVETEESEAEQVEADPKEPGDEDEDDDEDEPPRRTRKERRAERARQREERLVAEAKRKAYEEAFQEFQRRAQSQPQQHQQPRQPERAEAPEKSQEDWELEALEAQRALLNSEMVRTDTSDERKWAELTDRAAKLQARQQELTIRRIMQQHQQHQQRQPQAPRTDEFTAQLEVMDAEFSDVVGAPDWEVKTRPELDAFLASQGVDRNDRSARKLGLIRAFLTERKYNRAAPPAGREKLATTRTRTGGTKRAPLSLTQEQKDRAEFIFPDKPPKEAWARYAKQMAKLSDDDDGPQEIRI